MRHQRRDQIRLLIIEHTCPHRRIHISRLHLDHLRPDILAHLDDGILDPLGLEVMLIPLRILVDYSVAPEAPVRNFEQQLSGRNSSALR